MQSSYYTALHHTSSQSRKKIRVWVFFITLKKLYFCNKHIFRYFVFTCTFNKKKCNFVDYLSSNHNIFHIEYAKKKTPYIFLGKLKVSMKASCKRRICREANSLQKILRIKKTPKFSENNFQNKEKRSYNICYLQINRILVVCQGFALTLLLAE